MGRNLNILDAGTTRKRLAFSRYRHIPNYEESMAQVGAERECMLDLVLKASGHDTGIDVVIAEIARNASDLCVSFDEALYLRWRYCRNQQNAREQIAALRTQIGASSGP